MSRLKLLLSALATSILFHSCFNIQEVEQDVAPVSSDAFRLRMEQVGKSTFKAGNRVELLVNGEQFFPKMLADIDSAKHRIDLETFIMMEGRITKKIVDHLCSKSQQGVKVRVLLDAIGSRRLDAESISKLKASKAELIFFRPLLSNPLRQNNRTHRKYLIVDGKVAHTGGAGIADAWNGPGNSLWSWRDNNYRLAGPVVGDIQQDFDLQWAKASGEKERNHKLLAHGKSMKGALVQCVSGSPLLGEDKIVRTIVLALNAAKSEIHIQMAYSCPPKVIKKALARACERGVKVRILSSGRVIDSSLCRRCAHHWWKKLLDNGVEVYEYQPAMMHAKLIVVDRYLTIAGAANMDYRSYFLNDENSIHILNANFAELNVKQFEKDLISSKQLKKSDLLGFSVGAWLFQSQL